MTQSSNGSTAWGVATVPLFPLNTVLFPGGLLPLRVFEARYMDMVRDCLKRNGVFGVCLIRSGSEVGAPAEPEAMGCLARIIDCDMQQLGVLLVRAIGTQRFRVVHSRAGPQNLVTAEIELVAPEPVAAIPDALHDCTLLLQRLATTQEHPIFAQPFEYDNAAWVGYRLAEVLPIPLAARQRLLELDDSVSRLEILQRFIEQHGLVAR